MSIHLLAGKSSQAGRMCFSVAFQSAAVMDGVRKPRQTNKQTNANMQTLNGLACKKQTYKHNIRTCTHASIQHKHANMPPTFLPTSLLPPCLPACLPAYLPTQPNQAPTYLPTYLPTYHGPGCSPPVGGVWGPSSPCGVVVGFWGLGSSLSF